jgi:hypothetical protein
MITGILVGKETRLPKIALNVPEPIAAPSTEKRIKRLLINESVTEETFFFPFIRTLLLKLDLEELVVAVDGSVAGKDCICLMASLIYRNRALPLAFTVFKGKKGHLPEKAHIELVEKLKSVIPGEAKNVVLLGDGEFDGVELQKTLAGWGWKYVCRTACNTVLGVGDEEFSMDVLASMLPEGHFNKLKNCTVTKKKYGPVTAIAWLAEDCEEPLFLVTNFVSASMACEYYGYRFTIETFFSDRKSRGFRIDKSHLSDPVRLARLLFGACLAYVWTIFFGTVGDGAPLYETDTPEGPLRSQPVPARTETACVSGIPRLAAAGDYADTLGRVKPRGPNFFQRTKSNVISIR